MVLCACFDICSINHSTHIRPVQCLHCQALHCSCTCAYVYYPANPLPLCVILTFNLCEFEIYEIIVIYNLSIVLIMAVKLVVKDLLG